MTSEIELIKIGLGLLDTGKYQKSLEAFTEVIRLSPTNSEAYELRGIVNFRLLAIEEALNDTSNAIKFNEENHRAWYNKGEILKYKHKYEEAEYCYREADKKYSHSLFYLTGIVETTLAQKKYYECISFCTNILDVKPANIIALSNRGIAYARQFKYKEAIKDYIKLVEIGKRSATIYNNLGHWYSKLGDLKRAYNNLSVSLQLNSTHPYALNNMGYVKYLEDKNEEALELINKSLEIDPSNSYSYKNRALVLLKLGQRDSALNDLYKAKALGYTQDFDNEIDELLETQFSNE